MSLRYLPGHAENSLLALNLARKEATYLESIHRTLFAMRIDAVWVQQLTAQTELAEKVEASVSRFGRLQDHLGEKLIPLFAALLGESPKSLLDVLAHAEKMQWLASADSFVGARKLRRRLVRKYMSDPESFLQALLEADGAAQMLFNTVSAIEAKAASVGLSEIILTKSGQA